MPDVKALLLKFAHSSCTPSDIKQLHHLLNTPEGIALLEKVIEDEWDESDPVESLDVEKIYARIGKKLKHEAIEHPKIASQSNRRLPLLFRYAAVLFLIALSTYLLVQYQNNFHVERQQAEIYLHKSADKGEKRKLSLSDGTQVVLNAESELRYPECFNDSLRIVHLSGEAFFKVRSDSSRPFIVKSTELDVKVLGTEFNLKAFPQDSLTQVALLEGKVKVYRQQDKSAQILNVGQMASYDSRKKSLNVLPFDRKEVSAWKDGIIYFKDADYKIIKEKLEKWYGIEFRYMGKEKAQWLYNGEFNNRSLEYVLESLSYACEFTYTIQDKTVMINNLNK